MNDGNLSVPKAVSLVDKTVKNMQPVLCGISCKNQYTERWQAMLNTQHSYSGGQFYFGHRICQRCCSVDYPKPSSTLSIFHINQLSGLLQRLHAEITHKLVCLPSGHSDILWLSHVNIQQCLQPTFIFFVKCIFHQQKTS